MGRGQHWLLSDEEAKGYGQALANAIRHLPITMAQKYVDFTTLGIAIITYEGPRIAADMILRRQARNPNAARQPQPNGQVVYPFAAPPGPPAPPNNPSSVN